MNALIETLQAPLLALVLLVILDVLAAVLVAVKEKEFQWVRLADFLRTIVVPKVGGWILLEFLAFYMRPEVVPEESPLTYPAMVGLAKGAYVLAFLSLLSQLVINLSHLGVIPRAAGRALEGHSSPNQDPPQ